MGNAKEVKFRRHIYFPHFTSSCDGNVLKSEPAVIRQLDPDSGPFTNTAPLPQVVPSDGNMEVTAIQTTLSQTLLKNLYAAE